MTEQPRDIKGEQNISSSIEFDSEGFHRFDVPQACRFIVGARVNKESYDRNHNSLFIEFKNGYWADFKSEEVAEEMLGELANQLESVEGISAVQMEDRELFYIEFRPGTDVETLLTKIDNKVMKISQWDKRSK